MFITSPAFMSATPGPVAMPFSIRKGRRVGSPLGKTVSRWPIMTIDRFMLPLLSASPPSTRAFRQSPCFSRGTTSTGMSRSAMKRWTMAPTASTPGLS